MFTEMLKRDRERSGFSIGQAAWRLGVSSQEYREIEAGEGLPNWETYDRICKLFGWPQSFVGASAD
jgi:DNA-binding XRE family transcriptional regulator